jgi:gliding motility-associated-like protein
MTGNFLSNKKRLIFGLLIFLGFSGNIAFSQENLSGNINQPHSHVVTIGADRVTVDDATGFNNNDTILMIQMQGVGIYTFQDPSYGSVGNIYGEPGLHEFLIIQTVNTGTNEIIFRNNIIGGYDLLGNIQVVRVPYYNSATVTGKLSCEPWDSVAKSGGVLAMIIGRTLKLNADIDVSGLGFYGGKDTIGDEICQSVDPSYSLEYYPWSYTIAGYKGEGVGNLTIGGLSLMPNYMKGKGPNWTGGGGGDGTHSGGGGGGNGGKGGLGGLEDQSICINNLPGGIGGGQAVWAPNLVDRIFFGGGGGASTRSTSGSSSQGGKGGGIVIIIADTIMSTGSTGGNIIADGGKGGSDNGHGGSGGGGAGGSIVLSVKSYGSSPIKFSAQGGNGGDNDLAFGEGGGGGGGLLYISTPLTGNVTDSLEGGHGGNYPVSQASPGESGEVRPNFMANLTGFLYNSIRSSVTGDQVDSICSNVLPPKITGTNPVGGSGTYTYVWEKSYDEAFTSPITLTNDPDPINYTPVDLESSTVWFRRTVIDPITPLTDISKPVQIIVQPQIQNNVIVADPDTICFGSDPQIIRQGVPDLVVPSTTYLKYIWQDSIVGGHWGIQLAAETVKEYDPDPSGGLIVDTWYRRTVISGRCKDKTAIAKFTILPKLADNAFTKLTDTICFGGNTDLATIPGPTGGLSTDYRYLWEQSNTGNAGTWATIPGETNSTFDPDALVSLPVGDHFYRRIVFSGEQNACRDTTPKAARKVWPVITNNVIQADQTIGYDSIPLKITESGAPGGGAGVSTYKYTWVKDTLGLPLAPGPNPTNQSDYQAPNLKWTVSFRRIINSSVCTSTSNPVMITVDPLIINTIYLDNTALDTIYTGQGSSLVIGANPTGGAGSYSSKWYESTAAAPSENDWTEVTGIINQYDPGVLTQSTWFRRDVSSPAVNPRATVQSNYLLVTVLPKIVNVNISANQSVCSGRRPLRLNGDAALSGGDGKYRFTWQDSTSGHNWQDIVNYVKCDSANYKPPALTSGAGYRRIVYSGKNDCGVEASNILRITVNPLPGSPYAGPDQNISSIGLTAKMNASPPLTGETGIWEVLEPNSATTDNISGYNTMVRNLSLGSNYFLWTVSTDIGNCKLSDSLRITVSKDFEPSAFSPNGDGINDQFVIEGLNLSEPNSAEMTIVNSSGTEVFSTSNFNGETWTDWDGKNSRGIDLPEGTYYYLLKVITKDPVDNIDRVDKRKGFIILKRR